MIVQHGTRLGRYELTSLLGAGGMAEVWKAKITGPAGFQRTVVVKRVLPHLGRDDVFVQMFLAEAKLSALLSHPNIVQVHELGHVEGEYFMAMEYVDGVDLGWVMRRGMTIPIGFAVLVTQAVCRALGHAHALRGSDGAHLALVHRDVTPANIMLGREGTVKLLDFGIAKARGASAAQRTETGALKGKLGYMSPEQVDGRPVDHRTDLFAAGVVLHELLAQRRLFKGDSDFLTLSMMRAAEVSAPSRNNADVPPALDAICLRALAREPADRFATADDMAEALEPFLDGWNADRLRRWMDTLLEERAQEASRDVATLTTPPSDANTSVETIRSAAPQPRRERSVRMRTGMFAAAALIAVGAASVLGYRACTPTRSRAPDASAAEAIAVPEPATPSPPPASIPPDAAPATVTAPADVAHTEPVTSPPPAEHVRETPRSKPARQRTRRVERRPAAGAPPSSAATPTFDPESALP